MGEHSGDKNINDSISTETSLGHEGSTLKIGPVVWFIIGLSVSTVIVFFLMAGLFDAFANRAGKSEDHPSPLAGERQKLPPEPRLQLAPTNAEQLEDKLPPNIKEDHPLQEMKRVRAEEDAVRESALALDAVKRALEGKAPKRVIVVKGRIVNVVA